MEKKKILEAISLQTGKYSKSKKIDLNIGDKVNIKELISRKDKYGKYAWSVISKIINYASSLVPEVTNEHNNIDEALRLGFNWTMGPFEILTKIGVKFFFEKNQNIKLSKFIKKLYLDDKDKSGWYGRKQLYLDSNLMTFRRYAQILNYNKTNSNKSANVLENIPNYNIVEFTTKANTLDSYSMDSLIGATDKAVIIANDAMQFSAGVNLNYVMNFADDGNWKEIEKFIFKFQQVCKKLKYSRHPVISTPSGLAIGGGFEVIVQSDYVVSHTNVVLGLVETLVGLIPAGGGCKEMLWRWMQAKESKNDPDFAPLKVFDLIGYAKTATSPNEALSLKFLLNKDRVVINKDRLLSESEKILEEIKGDYLPPKEPVFKLSGSTVRDKMYKILDNLYKEKKILDHGLTIGKQLAFVLSGGNTSLDKELSEDDLYALELEGFMKLIQMKKTQERIKHTLETGKPLVN